EIYLMDADGGNQARLTHHPANDSDPDWSPDGTKIAFTSSRDGKRQIYVMNADGSHLKKLTDTRDNTDPDWSPDGHTIAFTVHPDWMNDWADHIAVMDADGRNRVRHEDHGMHPSWSPDGRAIAFVSSRHGNNEIYVISADGQRLKRVTHDLASQHRPAFSPGGGRIAYMARHEGFLHIYVVDIDGTNLKKLTHNQGHHWDPAWSPDGGMIAYYTYTKDARDGAKIHLMTANGQHLRQLGDSHDWHDFQPDISPLGLAVSRTSKTTTIWGRLKQRASNVR
ncbi:MAG: hypothetical protein OXI86_02450, partial [Candidatus Poribacteria bacterium]|nr:hypothetical protein [Candidatus Poribacteria bacterium]